MVAGLSGDMAMNDSKPMRGNTTREQRIRAAARRSDAGFSIVSVLVALILLSIGVLSVSNVLTQSVAMQTVGSQRNQAIYIAQTMMEEIRGMDPLTIAAVAQQRVNEAGQPDVSGIYTREVTIFDPGRNLVGVTVIVTAPRTNPIRLTTWVYDGAF